MWVEHMYCHFNINLFNFIFKMPKLFLEGGGAHNFILFYFIFVEARKKKILKGLKIYLY